MSDEEYSDEGFDMGGEDLVFFGKLDPYLLYCLLEENGVYIDTNKCACSNFMLSFSCGLVLHRKQLLPPDLSFRASCASLHSCFPILSAIIEDMYALGTLTPPGTPPTSSPPAVGPPSGAEVPAGKKELELEVGGDPMEREVLHLTNVALPEDAKDGVYTVSLKVNGGDRSPVSLETAR